MQSFESHTVTVLRETQSTNPRQMFGQVLCTPVWKVIEFHWTQAYAKEGVGIIPWRGFEPACHHSLLEQGRTEFAQTSPMHASWYFGNKEYAVRAASGEAALMLPSVNLC